MISTICSSGYGLAIGTTTLPADLLASRLVCRVATPTLRNTFNLSESQVSKLKYASIVVVELGVTYAAAAMIGIPFATLGTIKLVVFLSYLIMTGRRISF